MRRASVVLLGVACMAAAIVPACKSQEKPKPPPKPTEAGAKRLVEQYDQLIDAGKYEQAYALISPEDRILVSKKAFVESLSKQGVGQTPQRVTEVKLDGPTATLTIERTLPDGQRDYSPDRVIFLNGKWYQKLEVGTLLGVGIAPEEVQGVKKVAWNQPVRLPGLAVRIKSIEVNKTARDELFSATAKGKFVILKAAVTNTGKQTLNPNPSTYMTLRDSAGRTYEPSTEVLFMGYESIGAGLTDTVSMGFDVAANSKGFKLLVGEDNDQWLVDLKK